MNCSVCHTEELERESIDVGVGVIHGPYGCHCGWSEDPDYDVRDGPKYTEQGYKLDQWGGATPPGGLGNPINEKKTETIPD